jgi:hypothetical protein
MSSLNIKNQVIFAFSNSSKRLPASKCLAKKDEKRLTNEEDDENLVLLSF